jgi:hypothetical protein
MGVIALLQIFNPKQHTKRNADTINPPDRFKELVL